MTATWSEVSRPDSRRPDPAAIAQCARTGRVSEAASLYRGSEPFSARSDAPYHVAVAKALRETSCEDALALASQALGVALEVAGSSAADRRARAEAAHEMGDITYEAREYKTSQEWYEEAISTQLAVGGSGVMALSRSGVANCEKDKGNLARAIGEYRKALALAPKDPTFVFNLAQAYEYVQDYESAVGLLTQFTEELARNNNRDMTTVNHFAIPLLFVKLCFAGGPKYHGMLKQLFGHIQSFPDVATQAVQGLATHWAYYFFLSRLLASAVPSPHTAGAPPLFVIGDSHVLSTAWCEVRFRGQPHVLTPRLATGLQAFHLREGHAFLTVSNVEECFRSLPEGTAEALWVVGEIDCREGIPGAVRKGKYASLEAAVAATVEVYIAAVKRLSDRYGVTLYPVSVCPPCNPAYKDRIQATRLFTDALREAFPRLIDLAATVTTPPPPPSY